MKDFIWPSFPSIVTVGRAATPMLSPSFSLTFSASHVPENTAATLSPNPARPAPSASTKKLGLAAKSTKYSVTAVALSPPKSIPADASVPSPNNEHPLAT